MPGLARGARTTRTSGALGGSGPNGVSSNVGDLCTSESSKLFDSLERNGESKTSEGPGLIGSTGAGGKFETTKSISLVESAGLGGKFELHKGTGLSENAGLGEESMFNGGVERMRSSALGQRSEVKGSSGLNGGSKSNGVSSKDRLADILKSPSWRRGQSISIAKNSSLSGEETDYLDDKGS